MIWKPVRCIGGQRFEPKTIHQAISVLFGKHRLLVLRPSLEFVYARPNYVATKSQTIT